MKKKVKISTWCTLMSSIGIVIFLIALFYTNDIMAKCTVAGALAILCAATLFFMPLSISAKDGELSIIRPLKTKSIPLSQIATINLYSPTMAGRRICGSGGWFGYWGWFSAPSIGKYFAYYGKASDCFFIELKDGKKYLLGCCDAPEMVEYISERILRRSPKSTSDS